MRHIDECHAALTTTNGRNIRSRITNPNTLHTCPQDERHRSSANKLTSNIIRHQLTSILGYSSSFLSNITSRIW